MTLGLDFDGTYTRSPEFWDAFVVLAKQHGHRVVCVTARHGDADDIAECDVPGVLTYFTAMTAKDWFMRQNHGIEIDVWLDDSPEYVRNGR